eukprot:2769115-Pleurochrysis_carterae.AAC.1
MEFGATNLYSHGFWFQQQMVKSMQMKVIAGHEQTASRSCICMEGIYNMLGFPGAVCSIDGVHIDWH